MIKAWLIAYIPAIIYLTFYIIRRIYVLLLEQEVLKHDND